MPASDPLFDLIHSLSKSEKRYFRVYVQGISGVGNAGHLELFDAIRQLKSYDASRLKKLLDGKSVAKYLPTAKNYLYQLILKTMRAYEAERNEFAQIKGLIADIGYLYHKNLLAQCQKRIKKAQIKATELEDWNSLLEILVWERKLLKLQGGAGHQEKIGLLLEQEEALLHKMNMYYAYYDLFDKVYLIANHSLDQREEKTQEKLRAVQAHPLLETCPVEGGFQCMRFYAQILAFTHSCMGNFETALRFQEESLELWGKYPQMQVLDPLSYRNLLANMTQTAAKLEKWETVATVLAKMKEIKPQNEAESLFLHQNIYHIELHWLLNTGQLSMAKEIAGEIARWLHVHNAVIAPGRKITIAYNLLVLHFLCGSFREAMEWVEFLMDHQKKGVRDDLCNRAMLFLPLLYLELDMGETANYKLRSVYRFLSRNEKIFPFEASFMRALRKLDGLPPAQIAREQFLEIERETTGAIANASQVEILGREEFHYWLRSKITGLPIQKLVEADLLRSAS